VLSLDFGGGRMLGGGITYKGDNQFLITSVNAQLCNLTFYPEETGLLSLTFNFLTRKKTAKEEYGFHVVQTHGGIGGEVIGGELYHVITPPRTLFYAEANDVYAFMDEPITLVAQDIGEEAIYRWYDDNVLVWEGKEFETIALRNKTYKLEVTAVSDGYKDYTTAMVRIVPGKIEELFPNPTSGDLTIVCIMNNVTGGIPPNSFIRITNSIGVIQNTFPITAATLITNLNVSNYITGAYTVTLFCGGQIADVKTFVKN